MNIAQIIALAKKEFLALLRDSRSRMVLIAPPIFQMLIFGFSASYDINNVPIAVYNQDQGVASREYISKGKNQFVVKLSYFLPLSWKS